MPAFRPQTSQSYDQLILCIATTSTCHAQQSYQQLAMRSCTAATFSLSFCQPVNYTHKTNASAHTQPTTTSERSAPQNATQCQFIKYSIRATEFSNFSPHQLYIRCGNTRWIRRMPGPIVLFAFGRNGYLHEYYICKNTEHGSK